MSNSPILMPEALANSKLGEAIANADMGKIPHSKRFFPSKELAWCLNEIKKAGMPFKFPTFGCKKCHGKGYVGILNTQIFVGKKEWIKKPIPCECLLENDIGKLKDYAEKRGTKTGSPDANFNSAKRMKLEAD